MATYQVRASTHELGVGWGHRWVIGIVVILESFSDINSNLLDVTLGLRLARCVASGHPTRFGETLLI